MAGGRTGVAGGGTDVAGKTLFIVSGVLFMSGGGLVLELIKSNKSYKKSYVEVMSG